MHSHPLKLHPLSAMLLCVFTTGATWAQALETPTAKNNSTSNAVATLTPIQAEYRNPETTEGSQSYTPTATRAGTGLSLSLRETPQAISVVTRQRIEDQNMRTVTDVMANTPGISIQNLDTDRYSFNARGFTIDTYLYDGIPTAFSTSFSAGENSIDPIIYDRVEVVRGATGLLTGVGEPSASINFVRKRADSREFKADLSMGIGSWDTYRTTADLSTPLSKDGRIRGRLVASYQKNRSFMNYFSNQRSVIYGTAEADLSDNTILRLGFNYQDNSPKGTAWSGFPLWYTDGGRTNWNRSLNIGAKWTNWSSTTQGAFLGVEHTFSNDWKLDAILNYSKHTSDTKLLYVDSWPDRHTGLGIKAYAQGYPGSRSQKSADLKISGPFQLFGRKHELVLGASHSLQNSTFYHRTPINRYNQFPAGSIYEWDGSYPEPVWNTPKRIVKEVTKQNGLYLAARLNITDALKVIVGGRYSHLKTNEMGQIKYNFNKSAFTPYAGILYDLNDNLTVYTSYTSIFYPQSSQDRYGRWLDPLEGHNYEVGIKGSFLDGRLNASATLFQIDQDNVGQRDVGHYIPGTKLQAYYAAKGTRSRGYDLEISGEPLDDWSIAAGLVHWTAKDGQGNAIQTNQPRTLFKLFTAYKFRDALEGLTLGGGIRWQSKNYSIAQGPKGNERISQSSYALIDLMARYQFNERLSLQVNVNNLFDKKYYDQIGFYDKGTWGSPRNVMATLSYKY